MSIMYLYFSFLPWWLIKENNFTIFKISAFKICDLENTHMEAANFKSFKNGVLFVHERHSNILYYCKTQYHNLYCVLEYNVYPNFDFHHINAKIYKPMYNEHQKFSLTMGERYTKN